MRDEIIKKYNELSNEYSNSPLWKLISLIVKHITASEEIEEDPYWLSIDQLVAKYPIADRSQLHRLRQFAEDSDKFSKKIGRHYYFNAENLIKHVVRRKQAYPKIYNKLKENSFFGLEIDDT